MGHGHNRLTKGREPTRTIVKQGVIPPELACQQVGFVAEKSDCADQNMGHPAALYVFWYGLDMLIVYVSVLRIRSSFPGSAKPSFSIPNRSSLRLCPQLRVRRLVYGGPLSPFEAFSLAFFRSGSLILNDNIPTPFYDPVVKPSQLLAPLHYAQLDRFSHNLCVKVDRGTAMHRLSLSGLGPCSDSFHLPVF